MCTLPWRFGYDSSTYLLPPKKILCFRPCLNSTIMGYLLFLTLEVPTPQNGQTHSNNLSTFAVSVWSNVFLFVKVCIFWKCMQYTIHWDKTHMLKKFPSYKINGTKMPSFFFCKLQLISFTFNLWSLYELKYKVLV